MRPMMFMVQAEAPPGQAIFEPANQVSALDQSWVVPVGVSAVHVVMVSPDGGGVITLKKNGVQVMSVTSNSRTGCDGGGNGGAGGGSGGGGGGAGGYTGNGGDAGFYSTTIATSDGTDGSGGGGGGGGGGHQGVHPNPANPAGSGGAVGLKGQGSSGGRGIGAGYSSAASNGGDATGAIGNGYYGAGSTALNFGWSGGGLGWKNNLPVAPGDVLRFEAAVPASGFSTCGARLMHGGGRSFPSNAGDL